MYTITDVRTDTFRITGLTKRYGGRPVVDGADLTAPAGGQVIALLGPPGAGKSTLVDLLLGLSTPDAGQVSIHGRAPRTAIRAGRVGAMLQHGTLLEDCSVYETVAMIATLHRSAPPVPQTLRLAGVADLARRRCAALTAGQRQQVRFALAIAGDPDLVVLDEPAAALPTAACDTLWASVRALARRGRTVLIAARDLPAGCADRVVVLRAGRITADERS